MSWRKINSNRVGTPTMFSAVDLNKVMDLLNGVNTGNPVQINNPWTFSSGLTGITGANITDGSIADSEMAVQTTTKISTLNKTLLNSAILYADQANTITGGLQTIQVDTSPLLKLYRPSNTVRVAVMSFRSQNDSLVETESNQITGGMETSTPGNESGLLTILSRYQATAIRLRISTNRKHSLARTSQTQATSFPS